MKVVIIGSGNVATVIGRKILAGGHQILQVAGRNVEKLKTLSSHLNTAYTANLNEVNLLADIYIISVSDNAIGLITPQLKLNNKVVVHTAAAVSKDVLCVCTDHFGVLYPLQSLRKEMTIIPEIPILIDPSDEQTKQALIDFASTWTDIVLVTSEDERLKLHLAAVFVNNFTNHLFAVSKSFCDANGLNFSILKPIIKETISRLEIMSPFNVQTGPAMRKDLLTIEKHKMVLEGYPDLQTVYDCLTNSILKMYE
jgi:predicted short-subunit dehydrogenase-like oxidoreductase (DUF2520 family)